MTDNCSSEIVLSRISFFNFKIYLGKEKMFDYIVRIIKKQMKKLEDVELAKINGGFSGWLIAGISLLVTFAAGIIDGIARPRKCN